MAIANIKSIDKKECYGCSACYNICPTNAIEMQECKEGFLYPEIDENKCVSCGKCVNACPSIKKPEIYKGHKEYACYAEDKLEHLKSSSGGYFSILARQVLLENGIVFGAAFNENMEVEHIGINNIKDLELLRGTKYVQSKIGKSYIEVEKELKRQKLVVFSGTPCQVAGLKKFLGKQYDNLLCVDLICHGVPSPKVWKKYLTERFGENNVVNMRFRDKTLGVNCVTLNYQLKTMEVVKEFYSESPYIYGFINNYYTRPSCYHCQYKGIQRCSDITIGDFWGVKEFYPEIDDTYGVSAVIVHSKNGKKWMKKISKELFVCKVKAKEILAWNECLVNCVKKNNLRTLFYENWETEQVIPTINKLKETNEKENEQTEKIGDDNFFIRLERRIRNG